MDPNLAPDLDQATTSLDQLIRRAAFTILLHGDEPLYRGLSHETYQEYLQSGALEAHAGELCVGTGVFFTNDLAYAKGFASAAIVITSRATLDPHADAIDTRVVGYDIAARKALDDMLGPGAYDGYRLWDEIQRQDTITHDNGPPERYTYTSRTPVGNDRIVAIIPLETDGAGYRAIEGTAESDPFSEEQSLEAPNPSLLVPMDAGWGKAA